LNFVDTDSSGAIRAKHRALIFKHHRSVTNIVAHTDVATRIWLTTPCLQCVFEKTNHIGRAIQHASGFWLKVHGNPNASSVFQACQVANGLFQQRTCYPSARSTTLLTEQGPPTERQC
jgi:hypothetical protein